MDFIQKEKSNISIFGRAYFYAQLNKFGSNDAFCTCKEKRRNKNQLHGRKT